MMDSGKKAAQIILNNLGGSNCPQFESRKFKAFVMDDYGQAKKLLTELQNSEIKMGIDLSYGANTGNVKLFFTAPKIIIFQLYGTWDCITFKGMTVVIDKESLTAPQFFIESDDGISIFNGAYTQGACHGEEKDKRYRGLVGRNMDDYIFSPKQVEAEMEHSESSYREVIVNTKQEIIAYMNVHYAEEAKNEAFHQWCRDLLYFFNENKMNSTDVGKYLCTDII